MNPIYNAIAWKILRIAPFLVVGFCLIVPCATLARNQTAQLVIIPSPTASLFWERSEEGCLLFQNARCATAAAIASRRLSLVGAEKLASTFRSEAHGRHHFRESISP